MKPELILLHGALGCAKQLQPLREKLEPEFQVHSFDFDGHGGTTASTPLTMDLFADNLSHYIKHNRLHKPHIFGYSMGGYAALKLARKNPSYLGKIITLGTKFDWSRATAEREAKVLDPEKMEAKVPAFATSLAHLHGDQLWKGLVTSTAQMMGDLATNAKLTGEDLKQINNPVLVVFKWLVKMNLHLLLQHFRMVNSHCFLMYLMLLKE